SWNNKAIYIRTVIDSSVTNPHPCIAAIEQWNHQVGARFCLISDRGSDVIRFFERGQEQWPFTVYREKNGARIAGVCLNYTEDGEMLGIRPGLVARADIYINRDIPNMDHYKRMNFWGHEIVHAFMLDDHPDDDINSIASYQRQGRLLYGPSWEDVKGIAKIYGLEDLTVRPEDLDGIENVISMWHEDRYGKRRYLNGWRRWTFWMARFAAARPGVSPNDLGSLVPFETYWVKAKKEALLGFGRFELTVLPDSHYRWEYR
ncbi:MAG: hypothetical protein WAP23_02620, partial [Candidatus Spechtbacterales bacterium]